VPLSTSSSNRRLPDRPWGRIWLLTAVIIFSVLGTLECIWRVRGYSANLRDDRGLWALARRKIKADDPHQVVFIGDSRIQNGINLNAFHESFSGPKPIQLAMVNWAAAPVLRHLAEDKSFKGIVISSVSRWDLRGMPEKWEMAEEYIRYYETITPADIINQHILMFFQQLFVSISPTLSPGQIFPSLLKHKWPDKSHVILYRDRSRLVDYSKFVHLETRRKRFEKRGVTGGDFIGITRADRDRSLDEIQRAIARIQARGGNVVFVRLPTSGVVREWAKEKFREFYWDSWRNRTSAITIHFEDHPSLSNFECPDYVHLSHKDTVRFSKALALIVIEKLKDDSERNK